MTRGERGNGGRVLPLGLPQGSPTSGDAVSPHRGPGRPAKDLRRNGSARSGMAVPAPRPPRTWGSEDFEKGVPSCGGPSVLPSLPSPRSFDLGPGSCPGSFAAAKSAGGEAGGVRGARAPPAPLSAGVGRCCCPDPRGGQQGSMKGRSAREAGASGEGDKAGRDPSWRQGEGAGKRNQEGGEARRASGSGAAEPALPSR